MNGKTSLVIAIALLLFSLSVYASEVVVSVTPKNKALDILSLYPDEIAELEINVLNNGLEPIENINLRVSVQESLTIVVGGRNTSILTKTFERIGPGQQELFFVSVKPKELSIEKQFVQVNYGFETFTHVSATYVEIVESPLEVQARLVKSALDVGESSKIVLTLKNKGQQPLSNISADIRFPNGIVGKSSSLKVDSLLAGESLADREFVFELDLSVAGEKKILMLVGFEDTKGKHVLEREFFVDIQNRSAVIYFIIIGIIILIIVALFLKRNPSKDKKALEQPEVKELEGQELKTVPMEGKEIKK